jgi:type 1 fimbria pilin
MSHIIRKNKFNVGALLLLVASAFMCNKSYAIIRCGPDSNVTNSNTAFDFNELPNQIPTTVPVGTTIYDVTMDLELWCAIDITTQTIPPAERMIYVNRDDISNALGSNSGLTFYITINGDRNTVSQSYESGHITDVYFVQGLQTKYYTKLTVPVRVELVKTGQNISISPLRNDIWLFSIGDAGTGYLRYRATNAKKLNFTEFTCNTTTPDIYQTLPTLDISDLKGNGRVDTHTTDFSVSLNCNGNLWSTLSINMSFNGTTVPGLENSGVYQFFNRTSGDAAEGIGFQILHQNGSGDYVETGNNAWFKVGNFSERSEILNIPLRAAYYKTGDKVMPGEVTGRVTYTVDYM